jgi:hypothetical protein
MEGVGAGNSGAGKAFSHRPRCPNGRKPGGDKPLPNNERRRGGDSLGPGVHHPFGRLTFRNPQWINGT